VAAGAEESRSFCLNRGVKQGDPVSALLFIAVMESCFKSLKKKWSGLNNRRVGQYYGFVIHDPYDHLTNLRFADDVILFAQSKSDASKMLCHLRDHAARYGLRIHMGKTTILTNTDCGEGCSVTVGDTQVQIVPPGGSEKYLGRVLNLADFHGAELANRMSTAWRSFAKYKHILCSKRYPLPARVKLFESVVSPAALYGSSCWTVWAETRRVLRTT